MAAAELVADLVCVGVTTGEIVGTAVAAGDPVCDAVTSSFVCVTDGVTALDCDCENVANGVGVGDGVTKGCDGVVLSVTAAELVPDGVTYGVIDETGVEPAVNDDAAVTFVCVAVFDPLIVCVRDNVVVALIVEVKDVDRVEDGVTVFDTVLVGDGICDRVFDAVCVVVRDDVRVKVIVGEIVRDCEAENVADTLVVMVFDCEAVPDAVVDAEDPRDSDAVAKAVFDSVGAAEGVPEAVRDIVAALLGVCVVLGVCDGVTAAVVLIDAEDADEGDVDADTLV